MIFSVHKGYLSLPYPSSHHHRLPNHCFVILLQHLSSILIPAANSSSLTTPSLTSAKFLPSPPLPFPYLTRPSCLVSRGVVVGRPSLAPLPQVAEPGRRDMLEHQIFLIQNFAYTHTSDFLTSLLPSFTFPSYRSLIQFLSLPFLFFILFFYTCS